MNIYVALALALALVSERWREVAVAVERRDGERGGEEVVVGGHGVMITSESDGGETEI